MLRMTAAITSLQNPRVKQAAKLRDRRGRQQQQRIIIDGLREISRAVAAGLAWSEFFVGEGVGDPSVIQPLVDLLRDAGAEIVPVSAGVLAKLAFGNRCEGVVAIAHTPQRPLSTIELSDAPVVAVLEQLEKPGNVGAILRTADAAGIDAVLMADAGGDLFNPNTIRASGGAVFSTKLAAADSREVLAWLRERQLPIFAARVDGAIDYRETHLAPPAAIVLGSEADGLSDHWQGDDVTSIRVPMRGQSDSLNVSVTAGVLFYEALREQG